MKAEKWKRAVDMGRTDKRQAEAWGAERDDSSRGHAVYMPYAYTTSHHGTELYAHPFARHTC